MSPTLITLRPKSVQELRTQIGSFGEGTILPFGGGTKPTLTQNSGPSARMDLREIAGIVDYQPSDYTITVAAGTSLQLLERTLTQAGQFMPFDPPWIEQGSTVGGMVASGINGPSKQLWGGIRDFILAIEFVDGKGDLIHSGARVVKNTAGFDLPKFFVGSAGRFGILTSVTFKVFPIPRGWKTLRIQCSSLQDCLSLLSKISLLPLDIAALDFDPSGLMELRIVGSPLSLAKTSLRLMELTEQRSLDWIEGEEEKSFWNARRDQPLGVNLMQEDGEQLWRLTLSPSLIPKLEMQLDRMQASRQYSHAGNSLWLAFRNNDPNREPRTDTALLAEICRTMQIDAMRLKGPSESPLRIGPQSEATFWHRIQKRLDPQDRFLSH